MVMKTIKTKLEEKTMRTNRFIWKETYKQIGNELEQIKGLVGKI